MRILITGCAGFIGFHLANSLLSKNNKVYGIDNMNSYYSVSLKKDRIKEIYKNVKKKKLFFQFNKVDISNHKKLNLFFRNKKFDIVVNLAAQAGIRLSVTKPNNYFTSNLLGFYNLIEISKKNGDPKRFFCEIFIEGLKESSAFGKSHKQAETNAARVLIEKFITIGKI